MSRPAAMLSGGRGNHAGRPIAQAGAALETAQAALVVVHGRGGDAAGMLDLARALAGPHVICLAPQAAGNVWFPQRFFRPVAENEPDLSSALSVLDELVERLGSRVTPARVALAGFSQGACLVTEYVRRRGQPLGGVIGFSGGLIGDTAGEAVGEAGLAGMPVLLGCSEHDPYIPAQRVRETEVVLAAMGAATSLRFYPGTTHSVTAEEIGLARRMLASRLAPPAA